MLENWKDKKNCFIEKKEVESELILGKNSENQLELCIAIPTFRRTKELFEAVSSALNQNTNILYQIIVVDNDADGNSKVYEIMKKICEQHNNVLYYRNKKNLGMFGNLNRCIQLANSEWITILHDDDMLKENYISNIYAELKKHKYGIIGVFPEFREDIQGQLTESSKCLKTNKIKRIISKLSKGKTVELGIKNFSMNIRVNATGYILNRDQAIDSGGFNEEFYPLDFPFYDKMGSLYGCGLITKMLTIRRIGENEAKNVNTIIGCAKGMKDFTRQLLMELNRKTNWREQYCAVMFIQNSYDKYNNELSLKEIYEKVEITPFWSYMPKIVFKIIQFASWANIIK